MDYTQTLFRVRLTPEDEPVCGFKWQRHRQQVGVLKGDRQGNEQTTDTTPPVEEKWEAGLILRERQSTMHL